MSNFSSRRKSPSGGGFVKIERLLPKALERSGDPEALKAAWVIEVWDKVALKILGEIAKETKAFQLCSGTLYVRVPSPTWAQEVQLHASQLIEAVNKKIGKTLVTGIWTRLGRKRN
jgi:predicted nucleic acid-binding Zn ribbon protein